MQARGAASRIDMRAEERRQNFPEAFKQENRDKAVFADGGVSYDAEKSFAQQVRDVLSNNASAHNHIYVGETTSILKQLGLNDKPMLITSGHLRDINHKKVDGVSKYHGLTEDIINKLPYILNYPAIVFDSFNEKNPDAVCILSEVTDGDGLPILVIIKPDGTGRYNNVSVDSNFILSMYGKDSPQAFLNRIGENIDNVLFADKKRTQEMLRGGRLQLPSFFSNLKFNTIIHQSRNVVKANSENKQMDLDATNPDIRYSRKDATDDTATEDGENVSQLFTNTMHKGHYSPGFTMEADTRASIECLSA